MSIYQHKWSFKRRKSVRNTNAEVDLNGKWTFKNIISKRDEISMYFNYFPLNTIYQCVASFTYQLNVQSARALAIFSEISVLKNILRNDASEYLH